MPLRNASSDHLPKKGTLLMHGKKLTHGKNAEVFEATIINGVPVSTLKIQATIIEPLRRKRYWQ